MRTPNLCFVSLCLVAIPSLACDGSAVAATSLDAGNAGSSPGTSVADSGGSTANAPDDPYVDPVFEAGPSEIADSGSVVFTIRNQTSVPLVLPGGMAGRWLEIGFSGYSLWPANSVMDGTLCDADPSELGELPPPSGDLPVGGEFSFEWKANAFRGAMPVPGMSEEYLCAATSSVPLGEHQFLICARESDVLCHADNFGDFPPRLICASTTASVGLGHSSAEFIFDDTLFPTENCPQAEEIPKP